MLKNNKLTFASASIIWGWTVLMSPIAPSAQAVTFTYSDTTIDAPTWVRPVDNGPNPPTSVSNNTVNYSGFGFTVSAADNYIFQSTANFDNYTFLYQNTFNPTFGNELNNIVIGNDDNPTLGLSGFTTALNPGTNYYFVTTGFDNNQSGTFTNSITGAGNVSAIPTAVPEPATILGTLAAFGYGAYARRKMKLAETIDKNIS
ncbi:PEP-CTERM sorting domain-containing protein [Chamaesiphon minutus]|nr:PEP-CTERM sorting domain-containing protein [Chamaesiphon minutus]